MKQAKRRAALGLVASLALFCGAARAAELAADPEPSPAPPAMLDQGFSELYRLNFQGARQQFLAYQHLEPDDPLGKAAEAASYLYEEFNDKGVLTSAFFLNDERFLGGVEGKPSENRNDTFLQVNGQARVMAQGLLKQNPRDGHGLLVLTMTDGMESD